MSDVRNQDWYNLNASRRYPLDETATWISDDGTHLPNNIVTDMSIRFPATLGRYLLISSLAVTEHLVTITLLASDEYILPSMAESLGSAADAAFTPVAAITVPLPLAESRHYALKPMYPGVGGWVVFGGGVNSPISVRFSTPQQSLISPRNAISYVPLPVTGIGKAGLDASLTGIVTVKGGQDIEVVKEQVEIEGEDRDALVVRLKADTQRNVFDVYRGPCSDRPESGNCAKTAVEFLNTVGPDCFGDITVDFTTLLDTALEGGGGVAVDFSLGLEDTCTNDSRLPGTGGVLPNEYTDLCAASSSLSSLGSVGSSTPANSSLSSEGSQVVVDLVPLPYTATFDGHADGFNERRGSFVLEFSESPEEINGDTTTDFNVDKWQAWADVGYFEDAMYTTVTPETCTALYVAEALFTVDVPYTQEVPYTGVRDVGGAAISGSSSLSSLSSLSRESFSSNSLNSLSSQESRSSSDSLSSSFSCSSLNSLSSSNSSVSSASLSYSSHWSHVWEIDGAYRATDAARRNISVWELGDFVDSREKRVVTHMQLHTGAQRGGGLILNYRRSGNPERETYYVVELNHNVDALIVRYFNGFAFTSAVVQLSPLSLVLEDWYELEATIASVAASDDVVLSATVTGITDPAITAASSIQLTNWIPDGIFGVGSDRGDATFAFLHIEEWEA